MGMNTKAILRLVHLYGIPVRQGVLLGKATRC